MEKTLSVALPNKETDKVRMTDSLQEQVWVQATQRGDTVSFNRLVLKWERPIYNLAFRLLQSPEEAAEACQEIFLAAYRNIHRFRLDARFSTWLYRIASNHCISRLRRRPPGVHVSLDDQEESLQVRQRLTSGETHEGNLLRQEKQRQVQRALAELSPDQRGVLELKFFQDRTFEEISEITEIPLSTVKSRLYSGLEILKQRLGDIS